ncbi:MAG TPA: mannitol dehydrogenase family protein [Nakamurella sp.]|nr:mannitol dehydrogenase family protein [Nakamurella sp.]
MTGAPVRLSAATLADLPEGVAVPAYDRSAVRAGIVHLGVGGFHRAHQAMYLDRLMNAGRALDWGICGVGVLESDAAMAAVMQQQDCLYTLLVRHPDGHTDARVIGSIVQYLFAPDDPVAVIERMADPAVRIVSLTVTEGGYNLNHVTGAFDAENPDVVADLARPAAPRTIFGLVTAALARRRERGIPPFTVMSCDNIPGNGDMARSMFGTFAGLLDPDLGDFVSSSVAFPNSMVDRITPATTDADRAELADRFGVADGWPVVCEPFAQWVLQDGFGAGVPPLADAGVMMVDDVEPYELMKLRLLNCSHQGIAYFGYLAGYRLVHEAAADPLIASFLLDYMEREASPTLLPVPGIDLDGYRHQLIERFANPGVRDTIARLCADTSNRIPNWLLPVVRTQLERGGEVTRAAAIVASWARYAEGVDEQGEPIEVVDRLADRLAAAARRYPTDPDAFVTDPELFGALGRDERFLVPYRAALASLHDRGALATLAELNGR